MPDLSAPGDAGLFGPGSATWELHAHPAVLLGAVRALLLQALHPAALSGVYDHSAFKQDALGRLARTASYVNVATFGSTEQVVAHVEMVKAIHARVQGVTYAGSAYSANDPHLLAWVQFALVDSILEAVLLADPSLRRVADGYVLEQSRLAELWGARRSGSAGLPVSVSELRSELEMYLPELAVSSATRDAVRFLAAPPLPRSLRPAYLVVFAAAFASLPRPMLALLSPVVPPRLLAPVPGMLVGRSLRILLPGPSPTYLAATKRIVDVDGANIRTGTP